MTQATPPSEDQDTSTAPRFPAQLHREHSEEGLGHMHSKGAQAGAKSETTWGSGGCPPDGPLGEGTDEQTVPLL
jgi:hypothetical protein